MILNFEDELGKTHFEFVFVGFILGGSIQDKKGMNILRTEVALFEKLETISEVKPCGRKLVNGEPDRKLSDNGLPKLMQITMQEFDLLFNYMCQVPWQAGTPARKAVETIDWLAQESKK